MFSSIEKAVELATEIDSAFAELESATVKIPVVPIHVVEWLAVEKNDAAAAAIVKKYNALHAEYVKLAITEANVTEANVWQGSKGAKIRNSIVKGAEFLRTLAAMDSEIASNAVVSMVLESASKLAPLPSTKATNAVSDLNSRIRTWANANGHAVGTKGRISVEVIAAYTAANPTA